MSSDSSETETTVRLSPELRGSSVRANQAARDLFEQGTGGIYQGSRLSAEDPLIEQARQQQLGLVGQGGDISNMVDSQQTAFANLLGAGDINNPLVQRQLSDLADVVGEQFGRTILPQINQSSTAAGQYGSSRQGIAQGLAAGEAANAISRGATQALLGGQQVALNAQGMAPQSIGLGFMPSQVQQDVGAQRQQRQQMELNDYIQQFDAPRQAELQNLTQFTNLLASNPLTMESTQTSTTSGGGGGLAETLTGAATLGAGFMTGNPALGASGGLSLLGSGTGGSLASNGFNFGNIGAPQSFFSQRLGGAGMNMGNITAPAGFF